MRVTSQLAMALAPNLMRRCGGLDKVNEQDLGVEVVHGCLTEGGHSILSAFFCEPLRVTLQDK